MLYLKLFCIPIIIIIMSIISTAFIKYNSGLIIIFNIINLILLAIQAWICYAHVRKNK